MESNIDIEKLKAVTKIISHKSCADGIASAMICAAAFRWEPEVEFIQYGTPELEALKAEPGMLFVDFAPPADRAQEFVDAGAIVIDHHKGAQAVLDLFIAAGQGAFADEETDRGMSGASLAYSQVWQKLRAGPNSEVQEFARLTGIRDTWVTEDKHFWESTGIMLMLKFLGWEHFAKDKKPFPSTEDYKIAELFGSKYEREIKKHCDERVIVREVAGHKIAFHYDPKALTSDVAEEMLKRDVPITIGFFYVVEDGRPKMVMSSRSDGSFDVKAFAKFYGGGGHSRAAGFSQFMGDDPTKRFNRPLERSTFDGEQNPWFFAQFLFDRYVSQLSTEEFAPGV